MFYMLCYLQHIICEYNFNSKSTHTRMTYLYVIYFHNPKHKLEANIALNSNTFHYLKEILSSDANVCCCNCCYVILILHGNKRVGVQYKL
jgi:hypothetical protein